MVFMIILFVLSCALISECWSFCHLPAFVTDDLAYMHSSPWQEGRWFNVLFDDMLISFNSKFIAMLNFAGVAAFFYCALQRLIGAKWALVGALVCAMAPPVHAINMWPTGTFPSVLVLLAAAWARNKMPMIYFFAIFGIVFNACLSHYYFLLPLLFITEDWKETLKAIVLWGVFYVVGFIVAELYVYVRLGHFIELGEWRKPHPVHSVSDAVNNLLYLRDTIVAHLSIFSLKWYFSYAIISLPVFLYDRLKKGVSSQIICPFLVFALVSLSVYAQSFPAGIIVDLRSCLCLFAGCFFFLMWLSSGRWPLIAVLCFFVASYYHRYNMQDIEYNVAIRRAWYEDLQSLNYRPENIKAIVLLSDDNDVSRQVDDICNNLHLNPKCSTAPVRGVFWWTSVAYELGFKNVRNAASWKSEFDISDITFNESPRYYHAVKDSYLFLKMK